MHLNSRSRTLLIYFIARGRRAARRAVARGLNAEHPEPCAILTADILEWARDGKSVPKAMTLGTLSLTSAGTTR